MMQFVLYIPLRGNAEEGMQCNKSAKTNANGLGFSTFLGFSK
jgi:hypothetical protein